MMRIARIKILITIFMVMQTSITMADKHKIDIPYVEYTQNTWTAACLTMLINFYNSAITLEQVINQIGYPPTLDYEKLSLWLSSNYSLRLERHDNKTIDDILQTINDNKPVMVLQQYSYDQEIASTKIIVGYNTNNSTLLIKEPTNNGYEYELSFSDFQYFWDKLQTLTSGWPNSFFWTIESLHYKNDFYLQVPFEPNHGDTCASSSITMILKSYGLNIDFSTIYSIAGMPPIINYNAIDSWLQENYSLTLKRFDNKTIDDIILYIDKGYPVMVLQQFSLSHVVGHNRVVIGYNKHRQEFILNDPSELGANYRMSYDLFLTLWDKLPDSCPGWPSRFFWVIVPTK